MKLNLFVLLSITTACFAQNEPQIEALQESLAQAKAASAENMDRINQAVAELKEMDTKIEGSIAKTIEFTQRYTDSVETGERIMDGKKAILKDLIKSIERYTELEKEVAEKITKNRSYVKEDMMKIRDWADAKIILRVKQLTDVTVSLGGYDYYTGGRFGDDDSYDYQKAKRLADAAEKNKLEMIGKIKDAIDTLSKRSDELERELGNLSAEQSQEDINNNLNSVKGKITALENAIEVITTGETTGKRVGKDASRAILKEMQERVSEIISSSDSFFESFDEMMSMIRRQKMLLMDIEKYENDIEQLKAGT
jgi:hypothetical protein